LDHTDSQTALEQRSKRRHDPIGAVHRLCSKQTFGCEPIFFWHKLVHVVNGLGANLQPQDGSTTPPVRQEEKKNAGLHDTSAGRQFRWRRRQSTSSQLENLNASAKQTFSATASVADTACARGHTTAGKYAETGKNTAGLWRASCSTLSCD
jgi:hypothetical protein